MPLKMNGEKLVEKFMKCQFHLRLTLLPLTHICNFVASDWLNGAAAAAAGGGGGGQGSRIAF